MTLQHQQEEHLQNSSLHLDALYCQEEQWEGEIYHCFQEEEESFYSDCFNLRPPLLSDQDLLWEEEELSCLFSKEQQYNLCYQYLEKTPCLANARKEAVEWVLKVTAHHSFSAFTSILAVNYLDRFLFSLESHREKPWITQLTAVACLSLAAKVEETQVPLLLDLQVEESNYVFEAKTIQRMEILVLSTLEWKMNPVTPLSFLDYITRRLGLKNQKLCWEFLKQCQRFLLSVLSDCRVMRYLPSVLAIATVQHVVNSSELFIGIKYQSQLLGSLGINKDKVEDCCDLIKELESTVHFQPSNKHKLEPFPGSSSPKGINGIGVSLISDSYNDSWEAATLVSVSTSTPNPLPKQSRSQDQQHTHGIADILCIPQ